MKIVYIGEPDECSTAIVSRLKKEGNELYFVRIGARREADSKRKPTCHEYEMPEIDVSIKRLLRMISPEIIIYEGIDYCNEAWEEKHNRNLPALSYVLEACMNCKDIHFLFLSSTEVYGNIQSVVTEETLCRPVTVKGRLMLQEEQLVEFYQSTCGLSAVRLRISELYGSELRDSAKDLFGALIRQIEREKTLHGTDVCLQPLHSSDVADAIVRIIERRKTGIFNICSSQRIRKSQLAGELAEIMQCRIEIDALAEKPAEGLLSNKRIKSELEWSEVRSVEQVLRDSKRMIASEERNPKKRRNCSRLNPEVRKSIETIAAFFAVFVLYVLMNRHSLFSQVDWLLIYIVVISAVYGLKQSILSAILSSVAYLIHQGNQFWEMTNFYSYAEHVLTLIEFLICGIVVGYTIDVLKEERRICKAQMQQLEESYETLKEINDKNIMLKLEYERRMLEAKNSLPYLYSLTKRLFVSDTDRIFAEVIDIVKELIGTETVAVYRVSHDTSYLSTITALNEDSVMTGRAWDLKPYPNIEKAIRDKVLYEGDPWHKEPAIVLPIAVHGSCEAVIVIKTLSFERHSLYTISLLRTLGMLISASLERALEYEQTARERNDYQAEAAEGAAAGNKTRRLFGESEES